MSCRGGGRLTDRQARPPGRTRRRAALLGVEITPCRWIHTWRVTHTSSTAQVANTVLVTVHSSAGKANHTPASEHSTATVSWTSVTATIRTARTAARRTGSGNRGLAYMQCLLPLHRMPHSVTCAHQVPESSPGGHVLPSRYGTGRTARCFVFSPRHGPTSWPGGSSRLAASTGATGRHKDLRVCPRRLCGCGRTPWESRVDRAEPDTSVGRRG